MKDFSDIEKTLWKKAIGGYEIEETVLEFQADGEDEQSMKLVKKRVTKKIAPPDSTTLKLLIEKQNLKGEHATLDLKESLKLKEKLIKELKNVEIT